MLFDKLGNNLKQVLGLHVNFLIKIQNFDLEDAILDFLFSNDQEERDSVVEGIFETLVCSWIFDVKGLSFDAFFPKEGESFHTLGSETFTHGGHKDLRLSSPNLATSLLL